MEPADSDVRLIDLAIEQAKISLDSAGVPVGAVLTRFSQVISVGHNERVQRGDPVAHGEMACLRNAGRQSSYVDTTLFTTLSPCEMCSGAILLFKIPRVIVGENQTYSGDLDFLRSRGVDVILLNDDRCIELMTEFQTRYPEVWREDIGDL
jgi:cytosine deaminase